MRRQTCIKTLEKSTRSADQSGIPKGKADGITWFYRLNLVRRPLQVCGTQTCIKLLLGFLRAQALKQGEERKEGSREGRTVKLGFAHLIRSSVRLQFCISKTAVNKILWTKRND